MALRTATRISTASRNLTPRTGLLTLNQTRRRPYLPTISPSTHSNISTTSKKMSPYPTRSEIASIFKNLETGNAAGMMERVSPNVDWTVMGTHPCAGHYTSLQEFQQKTLARLGKIMKEPGLRLMVRNVIGGGDSEWATVELIAKAECLNGFNFENTYAWCVRFDESGQVVQVRAYLDSWMVKQAIEENEEGQPESHRAPVPQV